MSTIYYLIRFTLPTGHCRWAWKNDSIDSVKLTASKSEASRYTDREVLTLDVARYKATMKLQFQPEDIAVSVIQVTETTVEKDMTLRLE